MASNSAENKNVVVPKNTAELQRLKVEKLMKNPNKEVFIPEMSKEHTPRAPLEFIRNVWGSSAGAGSGDFHVYRGVRRREYARQKFMNEKTAKEAADEEYHKKVEENRKMAEERTAKKRAKRLKKKQSKKAKKVQKKEESEEEEEESEEENDSESEPLQRENSTTENGETTERHNKAIDMSQKQSHRLDNVTREVQKDIDNQGNEKNEAFINDFQNIKGNKNMKSEHGES